jgi:hypothetical protein
MSHSTHFIHVWVYKEGGLSDSQPLFDEEEMEDLLNEIRKVSPDAFWWGGSKGIRSLLECSSKDYDSITKILQRSGLAGHIFSP